MVAAVIGHHGEAHAHARTRLYVPDSAFVLVDVFGVVHGFVGARDHESHVERIEVQVGGGVAQAQTVVQAARAVLAEDEVLRAARGFG